MDKNLMDQAHKAACEIASHTFPPESEAVIDILTKYGYSNLSEEQQFSWLTREDYDRNKMCLGRYYCGEMSSFPASMYHIVIHWDRVHHMKALLLQTPLFAISKHSIPPQLTWIESPEWMRDILFAKRARWDGGVCDYDYDIVPESDDSKLAILKQLAFTMHANALFYRCCQFQAKNCGQYLLEKAPGLIRMTASSDQCDLPLYAALKSYRLADQAAYMIQIGAVLEERINHPKILDNLLTKEVTCDGDMLTVIQLLSKGHKKDIQLYRDVRGNSLLHILYNRFQLQIIWRKGYYHGQIVDGTKLLLDSGIDPTEPNSANDTVFDVLMEQFKWIIVRIRFVTTQSQCDECIVDSIRSVIGCVKLLLPKFNKEAPKALVLPSINSTPSEVLLQCYPNISLYSKE